VAATTDDYSKASLLIMFSILMDGLDGKVARITNTASDFGIQYDSLSDLIAFGAAPAVIYFHFYLHEQITDQVYYLLPIMYLVCGAIRLARFNVTASIFGKSAFTGLPIPAAAFLTVTLPLFYAGSRDYPLFAELGWDVYLTKESFFQASILVTIVLSFSMISTMRFDTPGTFWLRRYRKPWVNYTVTGCFLALWPLVSFSFACLTASIYYLLTMYGRALAARIHKTEQVAEDEGEPLEAT
jgi:CDP-diacylglycerol--serine O-phosphatidyltransferase